MMEQARELATQLALQATELINDRFDQPIEVERKPDNSVVTKTDIEINKFTLEAIDRAFPDHGFIGEELGTHDTDNEFVWICDPIDGTRTFTMGFPLSTYCLALLRDGQPVLSVVAYPVRRWLYVAEEGEGATLNDVEIRVSSAETLEEEAVDVMAPHRFRFSVPNLFDAVCEAGGKSINFASAAVTATSVGRGALVGAIFSGPYPWDGAASKLIVEEAGGMFTDLEGNPQRYDADIYGYVASNGRVHDELLELIQKCGIEKH